MNEDKEKWMEDVFQSMKGSKRAKPSSDLFVKIQDHIESGGAKVVSLHQWKYTAAAVVFILVVNTKALVYFNQQHQVNYEDVVDGNTYNQTLISTYQIY